MIQKSPFKFLDSFTKDDRDIFFGRDKEIEELHSRVFESKILLVYGTSGTGKSSLINCGLANKFSDSDWLPVGIRRGTDINRSLFEALSKAALTKTPFEKASASGSSYNLEKLIRSVWLDHFKPVFLIFDQFEELFIFGGKDEKNELIKNVAQVVESEIQCRFIFSMREEYLAGVTEFERVIPSFLLNRIRIEKMTRQNAIQTIEGPCRINNIEVEAGFSDALLEKLNPDTPEVELTWLQIFLDKIMRIAEGDDHEVQKFSLDLIDKAGEVKDILGSFLEEQISKLDDPETGLVVLKSFVSVKGTKHQITEEQVLEYSGTFGRKVDGEAVKELIQKFIRLRILRDKDEEGRYELRHDSLASKIFEKITLVEKELLEVKYFIENAYVNYEKRHLLLSEEDLKYIAPYEDKLFLNEKNLKLIEQSKQSLHKARRRRQNIAIAAAAIIIIILSFFTIWAMKERGNAITQQQIAETRKNAAVKAKVEADSAKQEAIVSKQKAEENEKIAIVARNQSEADRKEAVAAEETAEQQRLRAEQMSVIANEQARKAEKEKQIADTQRILAQTAEEKARRLSMLSLAQNLALTSVELEKNPELMGLLAVRAFLFNKNNGGNPDDPVIYNALNKAYSTLDSNKHSILAGSSNECKAMAEIGNKLITADLDGNIRLWTFNGETKITDRIACQSPINFIGINAGSKYIITGHDDLILRLWKFDNDGKVDDSCLELKGHKGLVYSAGFSMAGSLLATAGLDSLINIWNISTGISTPINTFKSPSPVKAVTFCGDDIIVSAQENGSILLWNMKTKESKTMHASENELPLCLAWCQDDRTLLSGCSNGLLLLFYIGDDGLTWFISELLAHTSGVDRLVYNKDFSLFATSSWDRVVRVVRGGDAIISENLTGRVREMIFSSDNRLIASLADMTIRVWETSSQKLADMICGLIKIDFTKEEWKNRFGEDIPYEKTCNCNKDP
jgi:WD40 repeat protein/energy-coupling factor transporter ATP-binding protein EcfA2